MPRSDSMYLAENTVAPASPSMMCLLPLQEHGGDASAGYAEMGHQGGSKGGETRKEQMAEVRRRFNSQVFQATASTLDDPQDARPLP